MAKATQNKTIQEPIEEVKFPKEVLEIFETHKFINILYFQEGNYYTSLNDNQLTRDYIVYDKNKNK